MVRKLPKILLVLLLISLMPAYVFAEEVGKITYIDGRVDIFKQNSDKAQNAREYDTLFIGDSVRTKSNSKAEIRFKDNSIARLAQNSKITIQDYQFNEKGQRKSAAIALERGKVRTIIAKMPQPADFDILTPNAKGVVKGSDIFTFYQAGSSGMLVADGALSVVNTLHPGTPLLIPSGNSVLIPLEKLPEGPRPYLDLEEKLYEQDTNIPFSAVKSQRISTITAQISKFKGDIKVITKGQTSAHPAKLNEVLMEGDEVQTGTDGLVEIRLDNSNALNLKPNTKLLIVRLAFNPQTREYENIFEVTVGKVKARVEGIKGKSKFEIKTPLAICGVRGTILYVNVSPSGVTTFIEGGTGYMTSLISGVTQTIGAGENSTANGQGGVSNPTGTSQSEREGFTEGWDTGNGTEGYSSPEGTTGEYLYNSNTNPNGGTGNNNGTNNNTGDNTGLETNEPIDLSVTESGVVTLTTESIIFNGAFGFYDYTLDEYGHPRGLTLDSGTINNGVLSVAGNIWTGSAQPIALTAEYALDPANSYANLDLWASMEDFNLVGTTVDGVTVAGIVGGIKNNNSLRGMSYAFYIKPDGSVGYLKSTDLTGTLSDGLSGILNLTGTITSHSMGSLATFPASIKGYSEDDSISGKVGGDISGNMGLVHASIRDQNWGLWKMSLGGSLQNPLNNNWSAVTGGKDIKTSDKFYFLTNINGNVTGNNELSGSMSGIGLDYYNPIDPDIGDLITIYDGSLLGIYDNGAGENNWWEALAAGAYTTSPLKLGGTFNGGFGYYDYSSEIPDVNFNNGSFSAVLGSIASFKNSASIPFTIIGEFADNGNYKLWGTGDQNFTGRAHDGASILGVIGGIKLDDSTLKGLSYAFYIRPDPLNPGKYLAGYIKSTDISGKFYPAIGMFEATGNYYDYLDLPTQVTPGELYDGSPNFEYNGTHVGLINGPNLTGNIRGNSTSISDQNWSLWSGSSGGTYTPFTGTTSADIGGWSFDAKNPEAPNDAYWLGTISLKDDFSGTVDVTTLSHYRISHANGDVLGTFDPVTHTWEALNAGVSTDDTWLTSSGRFVAQGWNLSEASHFDFAGLIGLTDTIWSAGAHPGFISMGEFSPDDPANPNKQFAWVIQKEWSAGQDGFVSRYISQDSPLTYTYTTYPDNSGIGSGVGAFYGLSAGVGGDGKLEGKTYSLYISPSGEAGVLYGDIAGDYYAGLGMYRLDSLGDGLIKKSYTSSIGILPENLYNNITWSKLSDFLDAYGTFTAGGGIYTNGADGTMLNIANQNWGVWDFVTNGTFYYPTAGGHDTWDIYGLTGMTTPGASSVDTTLLGGSWLGGITGSSWSNSEMAGTLDARWIVLRKDGTLSGRAVTGEAVGNYIEAGPANGTWQAGSAGQWVEAAQLLDTTSIESLTNFTNAITNDKFINTLAVDMNGYNSFISSATMNMNLFAMPGSNDGIWAAIINGHYSTPPTTNWALTLNKGPNNATLSGPAWSNGQWVATSVTGRVNGNNINGQAAGSYNSGNNTFTGAGTGTYQAPR